jgi:hypothetical protein
MRKGSQELFGAIDLPPMTNLNHKNQQLFVPNIADHPYVPNAVAPVGPHLRPN